MSNRAWRYLGCTLCANGYIKDAVAKFAKNYVVNCPVNNNIPLLQLERSVLEISEALQANLAPEFEEDFGINLKRVDLSAIEIDKESENYAEFVRLTKEQQARRAEIETEQYERVSKLSAESQFIQAHAINQQTEVLRTAAESMGQMGGMNFGGGDLNPAGMMMGMAVGGAMGQQMTGIMSGVGQMSQPSQVPPLPQSVNYMVAINGQQYGPYNFQQMQQMAQSGQINAQVLVWTQGMPQWVMAGSVPELAKLFAATPPPLPQTNL